MHSKFESSNFVSKTFIELPETIILFHDILFKMHITAGVIIKQCLNKKETREIDCEYI